MTPGGPGGGAPGGARGGASQDSLGGPGERSVPRQQELLAKADRYLAGGGLGLFTLPPEVNLVIKEGKGSRITSVAGKEYIDYHLGSGPALLGHGHPAITEAVTAQLPKGTTYYFLNEHVLRLAERLVDAIPCAEQVQFSGSGTEATLFALRAARSFTGRTKIMKLEGGWHGMHDYALWGTVPSTPSDYPRAKPDSTGIPPSIGGEVLVAPFNDTERTIPLMEQHADELAAVLVEPLQRVLVPEPGFLDEIRDVTARHGIVLIFDEIVTGFRIAWGGAQEVYGVQPDLATYGKAMAGGFPMSCIAGKAANLAPFDARRTERTNLAWASGTLNGNPISASAGNAALDVLSQPGVYENLHRIGGRLRAGIEESGRRHGFPTQALGEDAVFGVRFIDGPRPKTWIDLTKHDRALGLKWGMQLLERGLLVNPNEKFYISITHTDADVDQTLEIVDAAFKAVAAER